MSKKMISAFLVLFMVLNLIAGFPVMAEENAGTAESAAEIESLHEETSAEDAGQIITEEPAGDPENTAASGDTEETGKGNGEDQQPEQPSVETGETAGTDAENAAAADPEASAAAETNGEASADNAGDAQADPAQAEPVSVSETIEEAPLSAAGGTPGANAPLVGEGETVDMHVWSYGHGKVLVNGIDYGTEFTGTWVNGTEVPIEAVPDSGYRFNRWWIRNAEGSGRRVESTATTLAAGADVEASVSFGLETAFVTITPPSAGTTAAEAPAVTVPDGAGYGLDTEIGFHGPNVQWVSGDTLYRRESLDPDTVFEAGGTYYAYVRLRDGADRFSATAGGSTFNTDLQVTGGTKAAQGNFAATQEGGGAYVGIETIIAVTIPEADTHTVTFDMGGHYAEIEPQKVADGEKAVKPAAPAYLDKASDYDTTGLRFSRWNKYAPEDLTYETFWNKGYPFQDPVTEDMTVYALYETVLSLQAYDITNDVLRVGGTITWDDIYFGSPQTYSNTQTTAILGIQETLTANPNPGYKFVGWSSSKSKNDIECTDPVYSFVNEHRKTLYALFEEEAPLEDLTFDFQIANGAGMSLTDIVSSFTVNGEDWLLPVSGMQVSRQIAAGSTVVAVMNAGDNALLSDAALPDGLTIDDFMVASSEDGSGLTVAFTMPEDAVVIVVDAKRTVTINYDVNGGTKGPAWPGDLIKIPYTMGSIGSVIVVDVGNDLVNPETGEDVAIPPDGCRYAGLEVTDKNGAHTGALGQRITGLDFSEGVTFKILWEKEKTVTIRWSSIDGVDLMDPIEIPFTAGDKLGDILEGAGCDFYGSPFEKDGYVPFGGFFDRPITEFASYSEMQASYDGKPDPSTVVTDSLDIYAIMIRTVTDAELAIEPPVCGTATEVPEDGWAWTDQINPPAVSVPGGVNYRPGGNEILRPAIWGSDFENYWEGDFIGGEEYYADVILEPAFGYRFAAATNGTFGGEISVSGGEVVKTICSGDDLEVSVKVKAVHDPAEPVTENVNDPSCTEAGSHDEVVYCGGCGAELSRTAVEDAAYGHDFGEWTETKAPFCTEAGEEVRTCTRCEEKETRTVEALGHSWSAWVVTKEPTETEDGEEVRVCERCKEIETRVIPHLVIEYRNTEGDGSTFEKGSQDALRFVFSRSIEDEKTFAHFTGVQVDGQDLDAADYTAEAGSVIVHLKPGYLEKLPVGKHKVTALFDDGNDPSAEFIIKERQQAAAPEDKKPSEQTSAKTSGGSTAAKPKEQAKTAGTAKSPKTGDDNDLMLWLAILGGSLFAIFKSAGYRRRTRR